MTRFIRIAMMALTFPAVLVSNGCNPSHKWGSTAKSESTNKDGVTHHFLLESCTCDDRVYCVIIGNGFTGSAGGGLEGAWKGKLITHDGRQLDYSRTTKDGTSGSLTVENETFDFAKGGVFIISAKDKKTKVEQISIDMKKLDGGPIEAKLKAVGETEPRIGAFLKEAGR